MAQHPQEAQGLFQLALDISLANEALREASIVYKNLSESAHARDRYAESLQSQEQAIALARRIGDRGLEWGALAETTYALTMLGRWDEALARFAEIPDEQVVTGAQAVDRREQRARAPCFTEGSSRRRERCSAASRSSGAPTRCRCRRATRPVSQPSVSRKGTRRRPGLAAEQAFAAREHLSILGQGPKLGFLHALEAARELGNQAKANELLEIVEALPPGLRAPLLTASADRFRAHLAGDDPGADRQFTAAEAQLRAYELPFHLAVVQLEHAEWLIARGHADDAQPLLADARETFDRLEAKPWLERVDAVAPAEVTA